MWHWVGGHRDHALFALSTGFTGAVVREFVQKVDWTTFIGVVGSAVAASVQWWLNVRAKAERQASELKREKEQSAREERDAQRAEELRELLHALRKQQLERGEIPADVIAPPAVSSRQDSSPEPPKA